MDNVKTILEYMKHHNGYVSSSEVAGLNISNKCLQRMCESGLLERVAPGLYMHPDMVADDYYIAQYRCKKGVFSHETALFFHDLCDRTPLCLMMTIPSGYNTRVLKDDRYQFFYCSQELWSFGAITMQTSFGNEIALYDAERTLCDCLRKKDRMDSDLFLSALKEYMKRPDRDSAKLLLNAERLKIRDAMYQYLEVLL